jgi:hypothetical protein
VKNFNFSRVGTYVQRGSKFCFVVVLLLVGVIDIAQNTALLSNFTMLSAYCSIACTLAMHMQPCHAALPGNLARQPCPEALPGRLARQDCLAGLPGRLARQPCPAAKYQIQLKILHYCPISPCFQHIAPLHAPLPFSLARQPCPPALQKNLQAVLRP